MWKVFIVITVLITLRIVINVYYFYSCKKLQKKYKSYISGEIPASKINELQPRIQEVFKKASVNESILPMIIPAGYGQVFTTNIPVQHNMQNMRVDVIGNIEKMFSEAIGVFRNRIVESINPIYWIEVIIFLPSRIFNYLGAKEKSVAKKIAQIVYWFISSCIALALSLYPEEIRKFLVSLF